MASKVLIATFVAVASSAPAGPPAAYPQEPVYPDLPPVYNYNYGVNDPEYSGAVFSQTENRDNYDTNGEYRVNLPDGRVQIVSYAAGPEGYVADVKYEGEAAYPEAKPYIPAPAPTYKPAPVVVKKPVVVAPAPAPYKPVVVAPAPYKPVVVAPAPYKPVVVAPAPAVYHPAPVVVKAPVFHAAPVYHKPSGYKPSLINPAYTPKKYGFTIVANEEPAAEAKAVAPAPEASAPAPEASTPVEEAAPVAETASAEEVPEAKEAPVAPETAPAYAAPETAEADSRYRF